jgi:hypothetical protein
MPSLANSRKLSASRQKLILDRHHEVLLSGMGVTLQDFRAIYKVVNGLTNLPDPMVQANNLNHGNIAAEYAAALQAHQVQTLIRKQADDANRKLSAQVKKLDRQLGTIAMAKHLPRGRNTTGGASSTKRNSHSPSTRKKKHPNANGANSSSKGSKDANSGNKQKSGTQKSKRTKNHSNTRSNKQS